MKITLKPKRNPIGSWRGFLQPKRGNCPNCGKRGLGPTKHIIGQTVGRSCRYCLHIEHA